MPRMKPSGGKTSAAPRRSARARRTTKSTLSFGAGMMLLAVVAVAGAAMVFAARESSPPLATARTEPARVAPDAPVTATPAPKPRVSSPAAKAAEIETPAAAPMAEDSPTSTAGRKTAPATVAGCLERGGDTFRLKETSGADAPKARSWKSGFLRKGSASIQLVDAAGTARLRDHVGERVSVTGVLVDREMQVRSLRRLASTCN